MGMNICEIIKVHATEYMPMTYDLYKNHYNFMQSNQNTICTPCKDNMLLGTSNYISSQLNKLVYDLFPVNNETICVLRSHKNCFRCACYNLNKCPRSTVWGCRGYCIRGSNFVDLSINNHGGGGSGGNSDTCDVSMVTSDDKSSHGGTIATVTNTNSINESSNLLYFCFARNSNCFSNYHTQKNSQGHYPYFKEERNTCDVCKMKTHAYCLICGKYYCHNSKTFLFL